MNDELGFNRHVAERLREMADLLSDQGADRFRVNAYRRGADTIAHLAEDAADLLHRAGREALIALPGVGESIAAAVEELAATGRWARLDSLRSPASPVRVAPPEPDVAVLLDVDAEYRRRARSDWLPLIAPRSHNPSHAEWLPVLETRRGPWRFRVLFSNTELAHRLKRTSDWVVVHVRFERAPGTTRTVVTETRGPLRRKRVVRGRESECRRFYKEGGSASTSTLSSSLKPSGSRTNAA